MNQRDKAVGRLEPIVPEKKQKGDRAVAPSPPDARTNAERAET